MSDQSLATAETTNQSTPRNQYRRRQVAIDGQSTDPILGQYSYSTADGEYRCLLCPYRSRNHRPDIIRQHMVSHSDRRPYQCPLCPATYKRQNMLRLHHRSRHQLLSKSYVCPHDGCHKAYTQAQSLKYHIDGQHSPLRYRCLLTDCRHRRSRRTPFTCLNLLRKHQRRAHYDPLVVNTDGQHPVLPFNEWINSLADNYDTVVVYDDETEGLSTEFSAEALEVSDNMVANADNSGRYAPPSPSPPILPIRKAREVVAPDTRRDCYGVDTDHNHISGQLSKRRRGHQRVDHYSLGPSKTPQMVYECNFDLCQYTTGVFEEIADHFMAHWDHYNRDLGHESTDDRH